MAMIDKYKSWKPNKPSSLGANMYHEAVVNTSWYNNNLKKLVEIVKIKINKDSIIVDFGAGTGISALFLLQHLKQKFNMFLVDNSPSWLSKAYEILKDRSRLDFFILEKKDKNYATLADTIGENKADMVISANTIHLIPNLEITFKGIYNALKHKGYFIMQSGNILRKKRDHDTLMIDQTVEEVHELALNIIRKNKDFIKYSNGLEKRIKEEEKQRKLIFPEPRSVNHYKTTLKQVGFKRIKIETKLIKVKYHDWLNFLTIKRIQAGILPEIGGRTPTIEQEKDRHKLIILAIKQLFKNIKKNNHLASNNNFLAEWIYITAYKN